MSNCITDDIATCINDDLGPKISKLMSLFTIFYSLLFEVSINIHKYANWIFKLSDYQTKDLCLSFNLVPS